MGRKSLEQIEAERAAAAAAGNDDAGAGPDFTQSPEFKAAVAAAASEAAATILKQLQSETVSSAPTPQGSDHAFAQNLAMAIAQLNDQGSGKKRVAPEVVQARAAARELMEILIIDARREGRIPTYTLRSKVYLDEQLVEPVWIGADKMPHATEIQWPNVPSDAMIPLNDTAKEIHKAFMDSIGSVVEIAGAKKDFHLTPGGLVVSGQAPAGRANRALEITDTGLRVGGRDAPGTYQSVNVLGTVAAPARQTAAPMQRTA